MTEKEAGREMGKHKTWCCKAGIATAAPFDYRCNKCDKDITLEAILTYQNLLKS